MMNTHLSWADATDVVKAIDQAIELLTHQQHGPSGLSGIGLHALTDLQHARSVIRTAMYDDDLVPPGGRRATDGGNISSEVSQLPRRPGHPGR